MNQYFNSVSKMTPIPNLTFISILLFAPMAHAGEKPLPPPGSYGFDWLKPDKAQCQKITPELLKTFGGCEYKNPGGFGLGNPSYKCRISKMSEYIIFSDKARCIDELETMKANAP